MEFKPLSDTIKTDVERLYCDICLKFVEFRKKGIEIEYYCPFCKNSDKIIEPIDYSLEPYDAAATTRNFLIENKETIRALAHSKCCAKLFYKCENCGVEDYKSKIEDIVNGELYIACKCGNVKKIM